MGICTTFTWYSSPAKRSFSTRNRIFSYTSIPLRWPKFFRIERASTSITWNRAKCGDLHTSKISQMSLASGAGNPGMSRTRPKKFCCEASAIKKKNTSEIPGDILSVNIISSHIKLTCFFLKLKDNHCYGYITPQKVFSCIAVWSKHRFLLGNLWLSPAQVHRVKHMFDIAWS